MLFRILSLVLLIISIISWILLKSVYIFLFAAIIFTFLALYGVFNPKSSIMLKTCYRVNNNNNNVYLTFDDGPNPNVTPLILDYLKEEKLNAVFFVIGKKALKYPELIRRIHDEGHVIGIHSYEHNVFYNFKFKKGFMEDIKKSQNIIKDICNKVPIFFRPPFGFKSPHMYKAFKTLGIKLIGWDVRGFDTVFTNSKKVAFNIIKRLRKGSIILLHDGIEIGKSEKNINTLFILKEIVSYCKENEIKISKLTLV